MKELTAVQFAENRKTLVLHNWKALREELSPRFRERGDNIVPNLRGTPAWSPIAESLCADLEWIMSAGCKAGGPFPGNPKA